MLFLDIVGHLLVRPAGGIVVQAVGGDVVLDELIGTVAGAAHLAVHQRVGESAQVTGCLPRLGVHDDGAVQTHVIRGFLHELLPPCFFDVVLELHAQRTVVPAVCQTAVNLGTGKDEAAVFAQGYDFFHCFFFCLHHDDNS